MPQGRWKSVEDEMEQQKRRVSFRRDDACVELLFKEKNRNSCKEKNSGSP